MVADSDPAASGTVPFARVPRTVQYLYRELVFQSSIVKGSSLNGTVAILGNHHRYYLPQNRAPVHR